MVELEEGENPPKRTKSEEFVEDGGEDRISTLQDHLLIEILSRLPSTKDAIRTGTLSKRWEHVWISVPTLSFTSIDYDTVPKCRRIRNSRSNFFSLVDKTLTQCRQLNLKKLEVYSGYHIRFESRVSNWIRYAISRDVEELNLRFWKKSRVEVLLDQKLFICSCFKSLTLEGCKLNPSGSVSWKNLRSLSIFDAKLDEDVIENILSGSPVLKTLELNCHGYRRLDVSSKSVEKLVLSGYMDYYSDGDEIIEINAPNILSLTIQNGLMLGMILLLNVSCLVEANIDFTKVVHMGDGYEEAVEDMLKSLIQNLGHVKELTVGGACSEVVSRLKAKGFVFPSNVKCVERSNWFYGDLC